MHIKVSVQIENIFLKILTILEENLTLFSRIFQDFNCLSVYKKITNFAFHIGGTSCVPMSIPLASYQVEQWLRKNVLKLSEELSVNFIAKLSSYCTNNS